MSFIPEPLTRQQFRPFWEQALLYFHALCLDAPLVACVWSAVFNQLLCLLTPSPIYWGDLSILFITIWLGYIQDRWLDVKRYPHSQKLSFRHTFVMQNQKRLLAVGLILSLVGVSVLIQTFDWRVLIYGMLSLGVAMVYSAWVYHSPAYARRIFPRELAVAFFFTLATIILPFCRADFSLDMSRVFAFIILMIVCCWINLCSISFWESQQDAEQGEHSIAKLFGNSLLVSHLNTALALLVILLAITYYQNMQRLSYCSLVILTSTHLLNYYSLSGETKSAIADLIMLTPLVLLLL